MTCLSGFTVVVYVNLAGRAGLAAFSGREGILRRFLDALALPVPPPGQEIVEDVADGLAACPGQAKAGELARSRAMRTVTVKVLYS